jgi:threonine/homoserine/homoserine lactone efflux protein
LIGDATWAAIALAGAAFLVQNPIARTVLGLLGVGFLIRLAWSALRDAFVGVVPKGDGDSGRGDFAVGVVMSLTNPLTIAFWLGVSGGAVTAVVAEPSPLDFVIFFGGFMAACVFWCFFMAGLITFGRQFLRPTFFRAVDAICGLALLYFAFRLLQRILLLA